MNQNFSEARFQKGLAPIILILIIAVIAAGGYLMWQKYQRSVAVSPSPTLTLDSTISWKTYRNTYGNYEFRYPMEPNLGYTSIEGDNARVGSISDAKAQNQNNLFLVDKYDKNILQIVVSIGVPGEEDKFLGEGISQYEKPVEVMINGAVFKKYIPKKSPPFVLYVGILSNHTLYAISTMSELGSQIFSTFKFTR